MLSGTLFSFRNINFSYLCNFYLKPVVVLVVSVLGCSEAGAGVLVGTDAT